MNWHGVDEFFAMGGYGFYVWSAYAVTGAALGLEAWLTLRRRRRALAAAQGRRA